MTKDILSEINRTRELMGLSLIMEGPPGSLLDDIFSIIGLFKGEKNLINWSKSVTALSTDLENKTLDSFQEVADNLYYSIPDSNIRLNKLLRNIEKNTLSSFENDNVIFALIKSSPEFETKLYQKFIDYQMNKPGSIMKKYIEDAKILATIPSTSKSKLDEWMNDTFTIIEESQIDDYLKELLQKELKKTVDELKVKLPSETDIITKIFNSLEKNLSSKKFRETSGFKNDWFNMMNYIINKSGKNWYQTLTETEKEELKDVLGIISQKLGSNTIKITIKNPEGKSVLKTLSPEEIIKMLENENFSYRLIYNQEGEISLINKLDTNYTEAPKKFLQWIQKQKNADELLKQLDEETKNLKTSSSNSTMNNIINQMKDDTQFWENIIKNESDELPNIINTSKIGDIGESAAANIRPFGEDFELVKISPKISHFIDRNIGIDLIFKNQKGEYKFLQVKKTSTTYQKITNSNEQVKSWKLNSIQKPSQIDGLLIISKDENGKEIMFFIPNKVTTLFWNSKLEGLMSSEKLKFVTPNRNGYVEVLSNEVVILKLDGDDLTTSNVLGVYSTMNKK